MNIYDLESRYETATLVQADRGYIVRVQERRPDPKPAPEHAEGESWKGDDAAPDMANAAMRLGTQFLEGHGPRPEKLLVFVTLDDALDFMHRHFAESARTPNGGD